MRSGRYLEPTTWGDVRIDWHDDDVVGIVLPGRHRTTVTTGVPPRQVREFAQRLSAWFDGETGVRLVDSMRLERWLQACGIEGFRASVSRAMASIPPGTTVSYQQLAQLAGHPGAARAAGTVCSRNPLPIVVACHRVVPADGTIGRYGPGGETLKRLLLEHEGWRGSDPRVRVAIRAAETAARIAR